MSEEVNDILAERGKTHGDWSQQSRNSQALKRIIRSSKFNLPDYQLEALEMICVKLSRIITGNSNILDHWIDLQGYAALVVKELKDTMK